MRPADQESADFTIWIFGHRSIPLFTAAMSWLWLHALSRTVCGAARQPLPGKGSSEFG
jgi:hypothetical protein